MRYLFSTMGPSVSSRSLDTLLDGGGPEADAIKEAVKAGDIHRTALWRYRKGTRKPDADGVALLERLSCGKVPANGWEDDLSSAEDQPKHSPAKPAA